MRVAVIGAGLVGCCCAYEAQKRGHEVTVYERESEATDTCSTKNSGLIVPSHFTPLASPGMVRLGLKMALNPSSPVGFELSQSFMRWGLKFLKASFRDENRQALLFDLAMRSRAHHLVLAEELGLPVETRGLLMAGQTQAAVNEEIDLTHQAEKLGLRVQVLPQKVLEEYGYQGAGAVHYQDDCHVDPQALLHALRRKINVQYQSKLGSLDEVTADQIVVAAGSWSNQLVPGLPLVAGKGVSITIANPGVQVPAIFTEGRVAFTPLGEHLRVAGTMELGRPGTQPNPRRLSRLISVARSILPLLDIPEAPAVWVGNRPCSPDGIPFVGRMDERVVVATGHAMMGVTLAPITGIMIADILEGTPTLDKLSPLRHA